MNNVVNDERLQRAFLEGFNETQGSGAPKWVVTHEFEGTTLLVKEFDEPIKALRFIAENMDTPGVRLILDTKFSEPDEE